MLKQYNKLDELPKQQLQFFSESEHDSFDLSADWFRLLEDANIFPTVIPSYFCYEEKNEVLCIIPLNKQLCQNKVHQLSGLSNFYTSLYRPLIKPNTSVKHISTVLEEACKKFKVDQIYFSMMATEHPSYTLLEEALQNTRFKPFRFYCFGNWYLPVNGRTYDQYFQELCSKTRNTVKRRHKKFFENDAGQVEIITAGEKLEEAIQIWENIYNKSWKRPEPYPKFMPALIRTLAMRGWLRMGIAYYNNQAVAAQIWIVSYGRAAIYKLAYDDEFAKLSPGTVLTTHLMRHVLDNEKVNEVDYLVGDDAYKKDWMTHRRERWGIIAFNLHTIAGTIGYLKQLVSDMRKRVMQKIKQFKT